MCFIVIFNFFQLFLATLNMFYLNVVNVVAHIEYQDGSYQFIWLRHIKHPSRDWRFCQIHNPNFHEDLFLEKNLEFIFNNIIKYNSIN